MTKLLITGGSGFIGTNLIENLLKEDGQLLNIDNTRPQIDAHIPYWKNVDILNYKEFEDAVIIFDPDIIIHLAAITDLGGDTLDYYSANIKGTQNVIDIAKKLPGLKKIIFTSSMYVCQPGFIPQDFDTYKPHTVYGESKVKGELLVKDIQDVSYEWVIIRPTSIWGPWFRSPYIDFFNIVYKKKYFDFGRACTKTYGYIGNTVHQIKQLCVTGQLNGRTFYLGDLPPTQISEWANEISISMGKGAVKKVPYNLLKVVSWAGDFLGYFKIKFPLNSFRLSNMTTNNVLPLTDTYKVCGEQPYTRQQGVEKTLNWMRNYKGYKF